MAIEILVRLYDGTAGRRSGDFVSVKQVPHAGWGSEEGLPNYAIIHVTDVNLSDVQEFAVRHYKVSDTESLRSLYRLDINALKPKYRSDLLAGYLEVARSDINANIINRTTE